MTLAKTDECDWLRVFMRTYWPMFIKPKVVNAISNKLSSLLSEQWLVDKIPTVNQIRFDSFSFNDSAPSLRNIQASGGKTHAEV